MGYLSHKGESSSDYVYNSTAGAGTYAYVVDTGCWKDHDDFEGRVHLGHNAYPNSSFIDMDGHGTHVAGTIAGRKYGVAKNATVICVKVFHGGGVCYPFLSPPQPFYPFRTPTNKPSCAFSPPTR